MNLPTEYQVAKPQIPAKLLQILKGTVTPQNQPASAAQQIQATGFKFGEQKDQQIQQQTQPLTQSLETTQIQQNNDMFQINDVKISIQKSAVNTEIYGNHQLAVVYLNLLQTQVFDKIKALATQPNIDKPKEQINTFEQLLQAYEYQFRNNYAEESLCNHIEFTYARYLFIRMCSLDSFTLGVFQQIPQDMIIQLKDLLSVKQYFKIYQDDVNKTFRQLFQDKDFDKYTYFIKLIESFILLLNQTNILKSVKIYIQQRAVQMVFVFLQNIQLLKESQLYTYSQRLIRQLLKQCNSHYVINEYKQQLDSVLLKYDMQFSHLGIQIDYSSDTINMMKFDMQIVDHNYSNYLAGSMLKEFIEICLQIDTLDLKKYQDDQLYIYLSQKLTEYIQRNGELSAIISTELTNFLVSSQHSVSAIYAIYAFIFKNCNVSSNIYTPNSTILNNYRLVQAIHGQLANLYTAYPSISTTVTQKIMNKAPILLGFINKEQLTEQALSAELKGFDKNSTLEQLSQFVTYFYGFYFIDSNIDFISLVYTVADSFLQFNSELNESQVELMKNIYVKYIYGLYEISRINEIYPNQQRYEYLEQFIKKSLEKISQLGSTDFRFSKLKAKFQL